MRRADGEYRLLLHRKVPFRGERGAILKWYGSSVDIEEQRRAQSSLTTRKSARKAASLDLHCTRKNVVYFVISQRLTQWLTPIAGCRAQGISMSRELSLRSSRFIDSFESF